MLIYIVIWQHLLFLKDIFRGACQLMDIKDDFVQVHVHVQVHGVRALVAALPRWVKCIQVNLESFPNFYR
jgi:hypothetical protein